MAVSRSEESQALGETHNLIARGALRASFHLRRYMPLYAFGTVWVVMLALLPTIDHRSSNGTLATAGGGAQTPAASAGGSADNGSTALSTTGGSTVASGAATTTGSSSPGGGGSSAAAAGAPTASAAAAGPPAAVQTGTGVTKAGVACSKGVRQMPSSLYAAPCVAKYSGGNNGATYNGVTPDTIKIAIRIPLDSQGPNAQAVDQVNAAGGQLTNSQQNQMVHDLVPYFNKMFELYGRHVQLVDFNGKGNATLEAQSKGQEAACADANAIASSVHAFGVIRYGGFLLESQPFAECALQYKLYVPQGAPYFPEQYYQRWNPYVWATTMDCE